MENGTNLKMAPSYNIDIDFFCVCCCCLLLYSFRPSMTVSGCNDNGRSVKVNQSYYLEGDQSQSRRNPRQTQCDKKKSCFNVPPSRKHCNRFPVKLASTVETKNNGLSTLITMAQRRHGGGSRGTRGEKGGFDGVMKRVTSSGDCRDLTDGYWPSARSATLLTRLIQRAPRPCGP